MKENLVAKRVFVNPAFKDKVTILETCDETGGAYSMGELEIAAGGRNYLHTHAAFEETFTAIKGTLGVVLKKKKYFLQPGQSITIPLNAPHYFFNQSNQPVTCRIKFVPGHDGFPKGLAIAYGLATDGKTNKKGMPRSLTHLALIMVLTDTKPAGFLGVLFPLFRWLAGRARKKGVEKTLLDKYYYE